MEIGFLTAFLGGGLALLSPCSALLLPAFFAATVGRRMALLLHGAVFYVGLVLTLVPFGLGIGALGTLLLEHRGILIGLTSLLLVSLGVLQLLGIGFDLSRMVPGARALHQRAHARTGLVRTLLLGAVSGVAGFCAGPILGAVLTLALGQGSAWGAGVLLAVYGAGMVIPLVVIAALWQRLGVRGQRWLRGRSFTLFGRELHTTSVLTGLVMIGVGLLFWATNGLVALPALIPASVQAALQARMTALGSPAAQVLGILALAAAALAAWFVITRPARRRSAAPHPLEQEQTR